MPHRRRSDASPPGGIQQTMTKVLPRNCSEPAPRERKKWTSPGLSRRHSVSEILDFFFLRRKDNPPAKHNPVIPRER